jgi:hypothetical protein
MPAPVHLQLIVYNEASAASAGLGFGVLDNRINPRPDWYEYDPIRRHLLTTALDDAAFYGFFSPKFSAKTGLAHADVLRFVHAHEHSADVLLFSPQPDMGAFFLNVFEQGEAFDAGLIHSTESLLQHLGRPLPLKNLVMDSRHTVFSNYFVARPAFWRAWLALGEGLWAVCEGLDTSAPAALRESLTSPTSYSTAGVPAQRKVFVMERLASLLLATEPRFRSVAHNPFGFGWSTSRFRQHPTEAYISDALKRAWRDQPWPQFMQAFATLRERFQRGELPASG